MAKKKKYSSMKSEYINRDLSWLSFNERVLQEASDVRVPLIERLRFLGIFSNNLDEFYRVRVATLQRMEVLSEKSQKNLGFDPRKILKKIQNKALQQQKDFEKCFKNIIKDLEANGIRMRTEKELSPEQGKFVAEYFEETVRQTLVPIMLDKKVKLPFLKDKVIYLAIKLSSSKKPHEFHYALIEVPSQVVSRFLVLPSAEKGMNDIIMLDDVIRYCFKEIFSIFNYDRIEGYTVKITRDAELDLDDDVTHTILEKVAKSVKKRKRGLPVRFIYDEKIPIDLLNIVFKKLKIYEDENIVPGGRYHNFKDFMNFPTLGRKALTHDELPSLPHRDLYNQRSILQVVKKKDILLTYPYQSFNYIIEMLREAAMDPKVTTIMINVYRVARKSKIVNALVNAAKNGKNVIAVVELQARFDEEHNIKLSEKLEEEGVKVIFGVTGLKVHSKLILIERSEGNKKKLYAHVGTGNFHEGNAKIYGDHSLLTCDDRITKDVQKLFNFFQNNFKLSNHRYLMVSPFNTRKKLMDLINEEIRNARREHDAYIILKLNNLVDKELIKKLYQASQAGVKIQLIIRGICSLIPGVKGMSENIEAVSIVDRFLEHARVFVFGNDGHELMYISSADWMERNLDHRIEVTAPIFDESIKSEIRMLLNIQLKGEAKARIIDRDQTNNYKGDIINDKSLFRSQIETYKYFKSQLNREG